MSEVLSYVLETITPASAAHAEGARLRLAKAGTPMLERLGMVLAGAQHTARPRVDKRTIIVVAGDHGAGDPGIALGAAHPTIIAAQAIADGSSALSQVARTSRAPVVLVAAGVQERGFLPATAIELEGRPSANITAAQAVTLSRARASVGTDAMTVADATKALESGIALAISLSEPGPDRPADLPTQPGLDVLALGAIGVGSDVASAALLGAATGVAPTGLGDAVAEAAGARGAAHANLRGVEMLAAFGGPDTAVLAGLILAAASMNVPVILDGYATGAAALVAVAIAPAVKGYLVAAHQGTFTMPRILAHLGLQPVFEVGLGHGEGTGAAMVLPMLDQVAAIAAGA